MKNAFLPIVHQVSFDVGLVESSLFFWVQNNTIGDHVDIKPQNLLTMKTKIYGH